MIKRNFLCSSTSSQHQIYQYYLGGNKDRYIRFDSQFDSGNIGQVKQLSEFIYKITSASDCAGRSRQSNTKGWFYFKVSGFPPYTKGKFIINKVNMLWSFVNSKNGPTYKPCYKSSNNPHWLKLEEAATVYINNDNQIQVMFEYMFKQDEEVCFAFTFPYEYSRCVNKMEQLYQKYHQDKAIYFYKQIITYSAQKRDVYLLTLSERRVGKEREERIQNLFPTEQDRCFKDKKPVILISARVHPGQTPSSYALEGILDFLLNKSDLRSVLLMKFFSFKIIPMLNPDGVYNGHYRMDTFNQNLNRYYNTCTFDKQPSVFALKSLMDLYSKQNRLMYFFDLHAHPARKGCFIYGNALTDFVQQVENYVFCKLLAINTRYFEYSSCNFSKKHMNLKDRNEELTKQGSARVFAHKCSGVIHSFTLQLGYHFTNSLNDAVEASNKSFQINNQTAYRQQQILEDKNFNPKAYFNVGEALMITILDSVQKNPYSKIVNSEFCTLENLRRLTAFQVFHQDQRFRMFELHTYTKVKQINELIDENFYSKIQKYFLFKDYPEFNQIQWPNCFKNNRIKEKQKEFDKQKTLVPIPALQSSCSQKIQLQEVFQLRDKNKRLSFKERTFNIIKKSQKPTGISNYQNLSQDSSQAQQKQERFVPNKMISLNDLMTQQNKTIKQVNLTFEHNYIVLPTLDKISSTKVEARMNKVAVEDELKKQLHKQIQHFKKDLKKQVNEQINKNNFIRQYIKTKKQQASKNRKNKFYSVTQKQMSVVSAARTEEQSRLTIRLPFLMK